MGNINCDFKNRSINLSKKPKPIIKTKLLIGEGKDECNFFWKLLEHLGIEGVQIIEINGNKFKEKLPALKKRTGFEKAEIIAITCDADRDSSSTYQKMEHAINEMELTPPSNNGEYTNDTPKVGLYIFPSPDHSEGMLEDLCLQTVEDHESFECVKTFSETLEKLDNGPNNISKAKVQVFLAARSRRKIAKDLGTGAKIGHWNFDSPALNDLKEFLNVLK